MADGIDEDAVVPHNTTPEGRGNDESDVVTFNMPPEVELKPSQVDNTRLGAWCKYSIPIGCRFGPFVGEKVKTLPSNVDTQYAWEILDKRNRTVLYYLNASNAKNANWMRHVNCARYYEEQNLVSIQEGKQIFYKVIKNINPNEELLTWYEKTNIKGASVSAEKPDDVENDVSIADNSIEVGETLDNNTVDSDDTIVDNPPPTTLIDNKPELPKPRKRRKKVKRLTLKNKRKRQIDKNNVDSNTTDKYSDVKDNGNVRKRVRKKRGKLLRLKNLNIESKVAAKPLHDSGPNRRLTRLQVLSKKKKGKVDLQPKHLKSKTLDMISRDKTAQQNDDGFYTFQLLRQHIIRDRKGKPAYKCNICQLVYSYIHSLKRHFIRNHINYKYVSSNDRIQCNLNIELLKSMGRNLETGTPLKKHTPSQKDTTKINSETTKISSKTKPNAVEESASKPRSRGDQRGSASLPDLYWCNMCNKLFHTLDKLKTHSAVHPSMTLHPCHKCGLKFQRQKNLFKHHLAVHTGEAEEMEVTPPPRNTSVSNASTPRTGTPTITRTGTPTISRTSTPTNQTIKNGSTKSGNSSAKSSKRYSATSALLDNMDVYGEDEADSFNCYNCGRSFPNHSLMNKHVIKGKCKNASYTSSGSHSSNSGFMFACTVCKNRFQSYAIMCRHRRNEHQVAPNVISDVDVLDSDSNSAVPASFNNERLDLDQNTAYFASIPRGVAENVRYFIDGNQQALNQREIWFREDVLAIEHKDNQSDDVNSINWEGYNLLNEFTPAQIYDAFTNMEISVGNCAPTPSAFTGHDYNTLAESAQFTCAVCGWVFQRNNDFCLHMEVQHGLVAQEQVIDQIKEQEIASNDIQNANFESDVVQSKFRETCDHESEIEQSIQNNAEEKKCKTERQVTHPEKATTRSRSLDKIEGRKLSDDSTKTRSRSLEKPELMSRHQSKFKAETTVSKSEEIYVSVRSRSKEKSSPSKGKEEKSDIKSETRPESVDNLDLGLQEMPKTRSQSLQNKHRASSVEKSTRARSLEKEYDASRRTSKLRKSKSSENLTDVFTLEDKEINSRSLGGTPTMELAYDKSKRLTRAMKRLREDIVATKEKHEIPKTRSAARRMFNHEERKSFEGLLKERDVKPVKEPEKTNECDGDRCDKICMETSVSKFVCLVCRKDFYDVTCIKTHNWLVHPRLHCTFMELEKNQWDVPFYQPNAPKHGGDIDIAKESTESEISFKSPKQAFVCTKCEHMSESMDQFHVHILQCAGDSTTIAAPIPQEYEAVGKTKGKRHGSAKKIKRQEYKRGKYKLNRLDADDEEDEPLLETVTPPKATKPSSTQNKQMSDENKENKGSAQSLDKKQEWVAADMPICWVCGKIFAGKKQFRRHKTQAKRCFETRKKSKIQNHNPVRTKKGGAILYQCGFCQREFAYEGYFLNHIKVFCSKRKELLANSKRHAEEFRKMNENTPKLVSKKEVPSPIQRKAKPKNRNHKWSSWYRKKQARDVKEKELEKEKDIKIAKDQETVNKVEVSPSNSDDISLAAVARKTRQHNRMDNISKIRENLMRQSKRLSGLAAKRLRDKSYDDVIKMVSEGQLAKEPFAVKSTETHAPKTRAMVKTRSPSRTNKLVEEIPVTHLKKRRSDKPRKVSHVKKNVIAQTVLRRVKRRRRTALTLEGHRRKREKMKKKEVPNRSSVITDIIDEVASGKIKISPTTQYMKKLIDDNEQTSRLKSDDITIEQDQTRTDIPQDQAKIPLKSTPSKRKSKMKAALMKKKIGKMKKSLKTKKITQMFQSKKSLRDRKQRKVPEECIPTLIPDGMHKLRPRRKLHTPDKPPILQPALKDMQHLKQTNVEIQEMTEPSNELIVQKPEERINRLTNDKIHLEVGDIDTIKPTSETHIKEEVEASKIPLATIGAVKEITLSESKSVNEFEKDFKDQVLVSKMKPPELKVRSVVENVKCLPNTGIIPDGEQMLTELPKYPEKKTVTQVAVTGSTTPKKDVWTISIKTKTRPNRRYRPKSTAKTKVDSVEEKGNKDSKTDDGTSDSTNIAPQICSNQDEYTNIGENNTQSTENDSLAIPDLYPDTLTSKKKSGTIRLARRRAVDSITAGLLGESLDDDIDAPIVFPIKRKSRNNGSKVTKSVETKQNKMLKGTVSDEEAKSREKHCPPTKHENEMFEKTMLPEGELVNKVETKSDGINKKNLSSNKFQKLNADILKNKKQHDHHNKFSKLTELHIDVHQSGDHNEFHGSMIKQNDRIRSPIISPSKRYITINSTDKISPEEHEPGPKYVYTKKTTKVSAPNTPDLFEDSDPYSFSEKQSDIEKSPVISPSRRYHTLNSTGKVSPKENESGPKCMYTKKMTKVSEPNTSELMADSNPYSFSEKQNDREKSPVISPSRRYHTINSTGNFSPKENESGPKCMYTRKMTKVSEPNTSKLVEDSDPFSFSETEGRGCSPLGKYRHLEHLKMNDKERRNMATVIKESLSKFDKNKSHKKVECPSKEGTKCVPSNVKDTSNQDVTKQPPINEHKLVHSASISNVSDTEANSNKQPPIQEHRIAHTTVLNVVTDTDTKTNTSYNAKSGESSSTQLSPIVLYHKEMLQKRIRHDLKRHNIRRQSVPPSVGNKAESAWREPCTKKPSLNSSEKQSRVESPSPPVSVPWKQVLNYETGKLEDEISASDSPTITLNEKTGLLNVETSSLPAQAIPSKTVTKPSDAVVQPSDLVYMYQAPKVSPRECSISSTGRVRTKAERKQMHWLLQNQDNAQLQQISDVNTNEIPQVVALNDDVDIDPAFDDTKTRVANSHDDTRGRKHKRKHNTKAKQVTKHSKMDKCHSAASEIPTHGNKTDNGSAEEETVGVPVDLKDDNIKKDEESLVSPALSVENNWETTHLQMLTRHEIMWLNNQLDSKEKPEERKKADGINLNRKKAPAKVEKTVKRQTSLKKTKQSKQKITKMFKQKKPKNRSIHDKTEKSTKTFDIIEENVNRINAAKKDGASDPIKAAIESGVESYNKDHVKEKRKPRIMYADSDDEAPVYRNIFEITTVEGKRRRSKPNTAIAEDNKLARRLERNMWKMINDTDSDGDRKSKKRMKKVTKNKRVESINSLNLASSEGEEFGTKMDKKHSASESHGVDESHGKCTCTCEDSSVVLDTTDKDMDSVSISSGETIINTDLVQTSL
ncbi:unnamed protein product [Owenia fusiformis]|uniref:Uncharacterized protein n=1 Tax=Owenia fusiformis TaxID=6347 RepID=A0A8J1Y235_OWEFU|nr:unnamed protein product [Owenia fusiformis]